jgi:hypothetical protein
MEYLVLEMYLRHLDKMSLPEHVKEAFRKAFYETMAEKVEMWLRYQKKHPDYNKEDFIRDGMKVVDLNPKYKGI